MLKKSHFIIFLLINLLLSSELAFSSSTLSSEDENYIKECGYNPIPTNLGSYYRYKDEYDFLFSEQGFSTNADAQAFCKKQGMELDASFKIVELLKCVNLFLDPTVEKLAIFNFIKDGLTFIGKWSWHGTEEKIKFKYKRNGIEYNDVLTIDQVKQLMPEFKQLPALCVKKLNVATDDLKKSETKPTIQVNTDSPNKTTDAADGNKENKPKNISGKEASAEKPEKSTKNEGEKGDGGI